MNVVYVFALCDGCTMGWFTLSGLEFPCDIAEACTTRTEWLNFKMLYNLNNMEPDFYFYFKMIKKAIRLITKKIILVKKATFIRM